MKLAPYFFSFLFLTLPVALKAQGDPAGNLIVGSSDTSFGSESVISTTPERVSVVMKLISSSSDEEQMFSIHVDAQVEVFAALDGAGVTYEGQTENQFDVDQNTSFVRRNKTYFVSSIISAVALTDKQLAVIAALIDESSELELDSYSVNYRAEDTEEELQKTVIEKLLAESRDYQVENSLTLTPVGISKMDITAEPYGEDVVSELLEDNDLPRDAELSDEQIELTGIKYFISAELTFR